jgi:tetratricopeptide (TPR) repeat protein
VWGCKENKRVFQRQAKEGWSLSESEKYEKAISCFKQAVQIDSNDYLSWLNKGYCEECLGNVSEAKQSYRMFLELAPPSKANLVQSIQQKLQEL